MMRKLGLALFGIVLLGSTSFAQRLDLPGSLIIDVGLNSWFNSPTDLKLNVFQSKTVNIIYYYDLPVGNRGFTITPGIGLGLEKYSIRNDRTLTTTVNAQNKRIVSITSLKDLIKNANSFGKSKVGMNYIDLPVEFRYYANKSNFSRGFRAALGLKAGILYSSFTKIRYKDAATSSRMVKDRQQLGLNRFRYGVNARVGFGGFGLFGFYEISNKFESAPAGGQNTRTLTIGISIVGF